MTQAIYIRTAGNPRAMFNDIRLRGQTRMCFSKWIPVLFYRKTEGGRSFGFGGEILSELGSSSCFIPEAASARQGAEIFFNRPAVFDVFKHRERYIYTMYTCYIE